VLRKTRGEWIATLAVFVLLMHTMIAGFVDGAMAQPQLVDLLGNPICSAHSGNQWDPPDRPGNHSDLPEGCLLGCSIAGGHAVAAPATPLLIVRQKETASLSLPFFEAPRVAFERLPLNPRAPPVSA